MKKIDVYVNGAYSFTTCMFNRCKDAVAHTMAQQKIVVASVPNDRIIEIKSTDKVTAHFRK